MLSRLAFAVRKLATCFANGECIKTSLQSSFTHWGV